MIISLRSMIIRVAVKMEVKNKRKKELPLSREVEMLTMLHERGYDVDVDSDASDKADDADDADDADTGRLRF